MQRNVFSSFSFTNDFIENSIFDYVYFFNTCKLFNAADFLPFNLKENQKAAGELPDKGEIKADRELEIELNGGTLMVPADGVLDLNVNLHRRGNKWWALTPPAVPQLECIITAARDSPLVHKKLRRQDWEPISPQSHSSCSPVAVKTNTYCFVTVSTADQHARKQWC